MNTLSTTTPVEGHTISRTRTLGRGGRLIFGAQCTCGARSGDLTTSGMAAGWEGQHTEDVVANELEAWPSL